MSNPCRRCEGEQPDAGVLCQACTDKTARALRDVARDLPQLRFTAAGQGVASGPSGRISGTGHSDGISVHAIDVLAEVRGVVTGWLRIMLEEGVVTTMPDRLDNGFVDTAALCNHLASRMSLVRLTEVGADVAADVLDDEVPSICLALEGSSMRPALVSLVRQVVDTHRAEPTVAAVAGDRMAEAMRAFLPVKTAYVAAKHKDPTFKRTLRTVYLWLGSPEARYNKREAENGDLLIAPDTILELAKNPPKVRRTAA